MASATPLKVAIANDYEVVVRGLHAMLAPFRSRIEVVELDVNLPVSQVVDLTLYDTFSQTQVDAPEIDTMLARPAAGSVVVFTWNMHPQLVEVALAKGCRGYLDKSLAAPILVRAIERVALGDIVISPTSVPTSLQDDATALSDGGDWPGRGHGLSAREAEVIALITQGLTNVDIASRTYLSINSVKTYIRTAYRKIDVTRRSQAVRWGLEHEMIPTHKRINHPSTGS